MSNDFKYDGDARRIGHVRSGWNDSLFLFLGPLTDKKIAEYERKGHYSNAYRTARREVWAKRQQAREKREGGFVRRDGRLIYSPQ